MDVVEGAGEEPGEGVPVAGPVVGGSEGFGGGDGVEGADVGEVLDGGVFDVGDEGEVLCGL